MNLLRYGIVISIASLMLSTNLSFAAKAPAQFTANQQQQIETIVHNYLVSHPEVLVEVSEALQKKQYDAQINKAKSQLQALTEPLYFDPNSPVVGNADGKVTVIEFFDYRCPHCKELYPVMQAIIKANPNLRVVYKELPIFGGTSASAAKTALAANQLKKYDALHSLYMNFKGTLTDKDVTALALSVGITQEDLNKALANPVIDQEIKGNMKLAQQLGLQGTPYLIVSKTPFSQDKVTDLKATIIPGFTNQAALQDAINNAKK